MPDPTTDRSAEAAAMAQRLEAAHAAAAGLAVLPAPFVSAFRLPIPADAGGQFLELIGITWPGAQLEQAEGDPTLILVRPE